MQNALSGRTNVSSVSDIMTNSAVFCSPSVSSSNSSYSISSRSSLISNGASLAPQEIRIDLAVFPVTFCKGLFNQFHRKFTFQGKKIEPGTCFLDSWLISAIYIFWSVFNFLTSSTERPTNSAIFSSVIVPSSSIFFATFIIPSFNV